MKALLALSSMVLLGAAVAPPTDVQTGRSVAVDRPQRYWLSEDLNRLLLQKPAHDQDSAGTKAGR